MSDSYVTLVPEDPRFVSDSAKQRRARDRFAEIAPEADEIEINVSENVVFLIAERTSAHLLSIVRRGDSSRMVAGPNGC